MKPTTLMITVAIVLPLLVIACSATASALYSVDESEYALELRFGEVQNVRRSAGLYVKAPFIDSVQFINKKTLRADIPEREIPDQDKERVLIDYVVRYHITDPVAFRKTLRNEATAEQRISDIMFSAMRDVIAKRDRNEIIGARPLLDESGIVLKDDEGLPLYESLVSTRDEIGEEIRQSIQQAATDQEYGINILGADIKRADFPQQVTQSIIERMRAERLRIANLYRATGDKEYATWTAEVQKKADIIIAEARRDARKVRGQGDAEAIAIVQDALNEDTDFYTFLRSLESYQDSIQPGAVIVLTAGEDSYLDMFASPPPAGGN